MTQARVLRSRTPSSFRSLLFDICFKTRPIEQTEALTKAIIQLPCLTIPTHEIMTQCYHSLLGDFFFLLLFFLNLLKRGWRVEIFYFGYSHQGFYFCDKVKIGLSFLFLSETIRCRTLADRCTSRSRAAL
jgi:hypothetical protein